MTVDALTAYQRFYKLSMAELGKVGTPGTLDALTRELMATPRTCGLPDVLPGGVPPGSLARYVFRCAWDRRFFKYGFIARPDGRMTKDVGYLAAIYALNRAFRTWAAAGVGISFGRAYTEPWEHPDFVGQWRASNDPDVAGGLQEIRAHADFPPGCDVVTGGLLPKPLHFNDSEFTWNVFGHFSGVGGTADIETVALHEIGHLLGLDHTGVPGNIMVANIGAAGAQHTLGADDLEGLRAFYPPSENRITNRVSGKVLDVWQGSQDAGAPIVQWDWHGGLNQRFRIHNPGNIGDGYGITPMHLRNVDLSLGVGSTDGGAKIQQAFSGLSSSIWRFS